MSHTASIKAVTIQSIAALRAAIAELNQKGKGLSLVENEKPRAYFASQAGMEQAPFVIKIANAKYDIGLYPLEGGGYEARTDFWGGSVEQVLGVQACSATSKEQAKLGVLFQNYAIHAAMEAARKKGYQCRRQVGKDGAEQVIVTGM